MKLDPAREILAEGLHQAESVQEEARRWDLELVRLGQAKALQTGLGAEPEIRE